MTRDEMERHAALLFGYGWKSGLADALGVNRKTVSRWIAAGEMPGWAADRLRAMTSIPPPPAGSTPDQDRDDACAEALRASYAKLCASAECSGWTTPEIVTAMLSHTITAMRAGAGDKATRQTMAAALMMLDD